MQYQQVSIHIYLPAMVPLPPPPPLPKTLTCVYVYVWVWAWVCMCMCVRVCMHVCVSRVYACAWASSEEGESQTGNDSSNDLATGGPVCDTVSPRTPWPSKWTRKLETTWWGRKGGIWPCLTSYIPSSDGAGRGRWPRARVRWHGSSWGEKKSSVLIAMSWMQPSRNQGVCASSLTSFRVVLFFLT